MSDTPNLEQLSRVQFPAYCRHRFLCGGSDLVGEMHCDKCGLAVRLADGINYYIDLLEKALLEIRKFGDNGK